MTPFREIHAVKRRGGLCLKMTTSWRKPNSMEETQKYELVDV